MSYPIAGLQPSLRRISLGRDTTLEIATWGSGKVVPSDFSRYRVTREHPRSLSLSLSISCPCHLRAGAQFLAERRASAWNFSLNSKLKKLSSLCRSARGSVSSLPRILRKGGREFRRRDLLRSNSPRSERAASSYRFTASGASGLRPHRFETSGTHGKFRNTVLGGSGPIFDSRHTPFLSLTLN